MKRGFLRDEGGQVVVIVALMFTVLLGFSALAIDIGRYYAERRYLQDGADAAALACARAYSLGGTSAAAWAAGEAILTGHNLANDPLGITVSIPAQGSEVYYDNIIQADQLKSGILPIVSPRACRVALYVDVPTLLIQVVNPGLNTLALNARAYAIAGGGFVPVIVPKYSNGPGPGDDTDAGFVHHTMAEHQDWQCSVTTDVGCTAATTASPGREFVLFGASQKATNDNSFRGYIALDIRDFTTTDVSGNLVHQAYNGVAPDASVNTLKDFEAQWIREGYPGPDICVVQSGVFDKCAQVAVINGGSAGIFVPEIEDRYKIGDYILAQLYDGTVKTIPNFTISFPNLIVGSSTENVANQNVQFTFSSQYAASVAQVTTGFVSDNGTLTGGTGDSTNPWNTGNATSGSFATNPTPVRNGSTSYVQTWSGITTTNASKGIYVVFLQGQSGNPYPTASQLQVVTVNIAGQQKQFMIDTSDTYVNTASAVGTARTATYTIRVTEGNGQQAWNGGSTSITLQIDKCPTLAAVTLTCYFGASAPGVQSLTTNDGTTHTLTVEVPQGTADLQTFSGWVRAFGTDGETPARRVTRVLQIRTGTNVTAGGTTDYTDIIGYAVFKVTAVDSNDASGQAVTGTYLDPDDPALALAKDFRLVPWEYVP